jgi:hypothetical protein
MTTSCMSAARRWIKSHGGGGVALTRSGQAAPLYDLFSLQSSPLRRPDGNTLRRSITGSIGLPAKPYRWSPLIRVLKPTSEDMTMALLREEGFVTHGNDVLLDCIVGRSRTDACRKRISFSAFPQVYPKPVLVNRSFSTYIRVQKKALSIDSMPYRWRSRLRRSCP